MAGNSGGAAGDSEPGEGDPVAIEIRGVGGAGDLIELNRLFTAWVEATYHRRTHPVTGNHGPLALRRPVLAATPTALAEASYEASQLVPRSHTGSAATPIPKPPLTAQLVKGQDVHDRGEDTADVVVN